MRKIISGVGGTMGKTSEGKNFCDACFKQEDGVNGFYRCAMCGKRDLFCTDCSMYHVRLRHSMAFNDVCKEVSVREKMDKGELQ